MGSGRPLCNRADLRGCRAGVRIDLAASPLSIVESIRTRGVRRCCRVQWRDPQDRCLGTKRTRARASWPVCRLRARGSATHQRLEELRRGHGAARRPLAQAPQGSRSPGPRRPNRNSHAGWRDSTVGLPAPPLGYATDIRDTPDNRSALSDLCSGADVLFIEAAFAAHDAARAYERAHLTTTAAGEIARACGASRVEPFHFSPRYEDEEPRRLAEVQAAFAP